MNKTILKLIIVGLFCGGVPTLRSQDAFPPCWRGQEGSTYQAWRFLTADNPAGPDPVNNAYGTPSATIAPGQFSDGHFPTWQDSTNMGFWDLAGSGTITVQVPNRPSAPSSSSKYVRVQVGQYIGGTYGAFATVTIPGATYLGGQRVTVESVPPFGGISVDQTIWRLEPNPSSETVTITSPASGSIINEVVVDTICITNANTYVDDSYSGSDCDLKGWPDAVAPLDKPLGLLAFANFQTGVDRAPAGGSVNVAAGSYAAVNVNKAVTVNLGAPTAQATVAGLTLGASATLAMDVNGTTPGSGHDQWVVSGNVTLGGAVLSLTSGAPLATNDTIILINNTGANPVSGTFAGLPEGATNLVGGQQFKITYAGGSGNDVVLTMVNHAPIPAAKVAQTDENVPATMLTAKFLAGATDPDGDNISFAGVLPDSLHGGTVVSNASGAYYTPPTGYSGPDEFYFLLTDGKAVSVGTVSVTVRPASAGTFNMLPLTFNESGNPVVRFAGVQGHTYMVQRSVNSASGPWTDLSPAITIPTEGSAIGERVDTEQINPAPNSVFYRTRHVGP